MKKMIGGLTFAMALFVLLGFSSGVAQAGPCELPEFDVANFGSPQDNNIYFPYELDVTYEYQAETEDELVLNWIYVSNNTVSILGVDCTVVYDVEWVYVEEKNQWFKTEETEDWHAWDNFGNFWYFGEWTTEYEYDDDWNLTGQNNDGSWKAGEFDALPGIIVPADPKVGTCFQQEYYKDEAEDLGRILRLNGEVSIELGDFEDCLVMKEWTKLEPGNIEHKYYCPDPGLGLMFIEELKEKTVFVELVDKFTGPPTQPPPLP